MNPIHSLNRLAYKALTIGFGKGPHITRLAMYARLKTFRRAWSPEANALSISGSQEPCRLLGVTDDQITNAAYPEHSIFDLKFADESFDLVCSDQVLEHIEGDPFDAIRECFRVLKPGGIGLHATCFINPIHKYPGDYWRFTPDALRLLCSPYGEVIECDGWGNPYVWAWCGAGLRFEPMPYSRWHPFNWIATHNHPEWPVVTWCITKKHSQLSPRP